MQKVHMHTHCYVFYSLSNPNPGEKILNTNGTEFLLPLFDSGRKLENPDKAYANMGKTCKTPHRKPSLKSK